MKNKKLFAILTLVCFMFTLMPVAAFAADPVYDTDQVYVSATATAPVPNDTNDGTELDLTLTDVTKGVGFNAFVGNVADKGATATTESFVFYVVDENEKIVDVNRGGAFSELRVAGDYTVYAINVAADAKAKTAYENVDAELAKITSPESKVNAIKTWAGAGKLVGGTATVTVETPDYVYQIVLTEDTSTKTGLVNSQKVVDNGDGKFSTGIEASNGFAKDGGVIATLYYGDEKAYKEAVKAEKDFTDWKAVSAGYELSISEAGYVDVAYDTLKTDKKGQVKFSVSADYANANNKVIVKYGTKAKAELTVDATIGQVSGVALNNEPVAPMNNEDALTRANVEFKFTDANGVAIELNGTAADAKADPKKDATVNEAQLLAQDIAITVVEKPAKSTVKAKDFYLVKELYTAVDADAAGVYTLAYAKDGGKLDQDGTYVIKVALKNGASATATVKVAEMGDVVAIKFVKAPITVAYGATTQIANVIAVDANGVSKSISDEVELSASGLAVKAFYDKDTKIDEKTTMKKGMLTVKDDDEYIGSKVTVLAVYEDFTATTELTVVDQAATVKYLSNTAEVGLTADLIGMVFDAEGKTTGIGTSEEVKVIVLDKPEDAVVVATADKKLNSKQQVVTHFLANTPGEYKIQTIITYTEGGAVKYISGIETITVGGGVNTFKDVVVVSLGADKMIVNNEVVALDVAPFIENNRTMMQFNVLYVFGIDVQWVKETESIVAEGNGLKVVMNLGSKVAVVNGEEVALDVAPYSVNGRTVVPVGFITGLLDITPTFTYNADGTIADILFTK